MLNLPIAMRVGKPSSMSTPSHRHASEPAKLQQKGLSERQTFVPPQPSTGRARRGSRPGNQRRPHMYGTNPPLLVQTNLLLSLASSRASVLAKCKIFLRSGGACSRNSRGGTGGANRSILTVAATNARQQRHSIAGLGSSSSGCG
jgi:hypothetical protein